MRFLQELPQQLVNGLAQGSIYALIALGYTLVYGVLRFINFAHGDVYMLGAYAGLFAASWVGATKLLDNGHAPGLPLIILIFVIAMLLAAAAGVLIERVAYRPLRNSPRLTVLISAIGVSMLLEYGGQAVFSAKPQSFPTLIAERPLIALQQPAVSISLLQVMIVLVMVGLMVALQTIILKTRLGRAMRAVSLDRSAAALMGINTDSIITFTFALGAALAAVAGIMNSNYQHSVDPLMGLMAGLKAFVAAVLGGIGSIPGAVLGGLLLGFAEVIVVAVGKSEYKDAIAFALLIIVLLVRPSGLLGRVTAEKV